MPVALNVRKAWSENRSGKPDFIPDPNAICEDVDKKSKYIIFYRKVRNPETGVWEKVFVGTKAGADVVKDKRRKVVTPDERRKSALRHAESLGMKVPTELKEKFSVDEKAEANPFECACGFVATNEKQLVKHKSKCTFIIDSVKAMTTKPEEPKKKEAKE